MASSNHDTIIVNTFMRLEAVQSSILIEKGYFFNDSTVIFFLKKESPSTVFYFADMWLKVIILRASVSTLTSLHSSTSFGVEDMSALFLQTKDRKYASVLYFLPITQTKDLIGNLSRIAKFFLVDISCVAIWQFAYNFTTFLTVCAFHFVEIGTAFCLYLHSALEFLN